MKSKPNLYKKIRKIIGYCTIIMATVCVISTPILLIKAYQLTENINEQQKEITLLNNKVEIYKKLSSDLNKQTEVSTVESTEEPHVHISESVSNAKKYIEKELPSEVTGNFKTYMDYRTIKNRNSVQWKLQQGAVTDEHGFRKHNDMYMIALGTYYSPNAGMEFEIEFSSGRIIRCITGDVKSERHTDSSNRYVKHNKNIVEFIVDSKKIGSTSKKMGDMSYSEMGGSVVRIAEIRYEEKLEGEYDEN